MCYLVIAVTIVILRQSKDAPLKEIKAIYDKSAASPFRVARRVTQTRFQYLQLEKELLLRYNTTCLREANTEKEVGKMFFFNCGNCCGNDCSSIWQILSQICGFGC